MSEPGRPASSVTMAWVRAGLESAVNKVIALDPQSQRRCGELAGKIVRIEIEGFDLTLNLGFDGSGIHFDTQGGEAVDTVISGTPLALLSLLGDGGPGAVFSGEVRMRGDSRTGKRLHRLFSAMDIDWEEQLSRLTGDLIARKTRVTLKDLDHWRRRSMDSLALDIGEYLQEETGLLAGRADVDTLIDSIDTFCQDVDRLEARVRLRMARH